MNRRYALLAALLVLLVGVGSLVGPVAGQQSTTTGNETSAETKDVVRQVDSSIRVTSYSYSEEREVFRVQLENTGAEDVQVTITEVLTEKRAKGSGTFGIRVVEVDPDETITVEVEVKKEGLDAVMILTPESVEKGAGTFLSVDDNERKSIFRGEASWNDVRIGSFVGIGGTGLLVVVAAWHKVAQKSTDVEDVEVGES